MSGYEHRDNSGTLFRNDKKSEPKHPDYKGSCMIDGVEYWMSSWIKEGRNGGAKFMSFSFQPKDGQSKSQSSGQRTQQYDDEVPF